MKVRHALRLALAASIIIAACSGSDDDDTSNNCIEGEAQECACGGGELGVQVCGGDGTFGACEQCSTPTASSSGGANGVGGAGGSGASSEGGSATTSAGGSESGTNGAPCADDSECLSGSCEDAVCCATVCDGECVACDIPGNVGTCTPIEAPTDPDGECPLGALCDGAGSCAIQGAWATNVLASDTHGVVGPAGDAFIATRLLSDTPVDLGNGPLTPVGEMDGVIARFDNNGQHVWTKVFGGVGARVQFQDIAVDSQNNVIAVAAFRDAPVDFGDGDLTPNESDALVVKLDETGDLVFAALYGATGNQGAHRVAVLPSGDIAISGTYDGSLDFGGGDLPLFGLVDVFVARIDGNGVHDWSVGFGTTASDNVPEVAAGLNDVVAFGGRTLSTLNVGGDDLDPGSDEGCYFALYDGAGMHKWSKVFVSMSVPYVRGVAVDGNGNVIGLGSVQGDINFGGGNIPTLTTTTQRFVAALAGADGVHVWSTSFAGQSVDEWDVAADADGVVIVGEALALLLPGNVSVVNGSAGPFILNFDNGGALLSSGLFESVGRAIPTEVTLDADGNALLSGNFSTGGFGYADIGGAIATGTSEHSFMVQVLR